MAAAFGVNEKRLGYLVSGPGGAFAAVAGVCLALTTRSRRCRSTPGWAWCSPAVMIGGLGSADRAAGRRHRDRRERGAHHGGHRADLGAAGVVLAPDRASCSSGRRGSDEARRDCRRRRRLAGRVPFLGLPAFYETFLYLLLHAIVLATSWNILSGYSGYFSFGHGAFFGAGVYTTAALPASSTGRSSRRCRSRRRRRAARRRRSARSCSACARCAASCSPCSRSPSPSSSPRSCLNTVDGGPGIQVMPSEMPRIAPDRVGHALSLLMLAIAARRCGSRTRCITRASGTGLFAIHDDEDVAEVMGVPTYRYKLGGVRHLVRARRPGRRHPCRVRLLRHRGGDLLHRARRQRRADERARRHAPLARAGGGRHRDHALLYAFTAGQAPVLGRR